MVVARTAPSVTRRMRNYPLPVYGRSPMLAGRLASMLGEEEMNGGKAPMRELLILLLVLACPLVMFFMMRGGHGHAGHSHTTSAHVSDEQRLSAGELRRRRGELDRLIEERERAERPVANEATPLRPLDALSGGERERRR